MKHDAIYARYSSHAQDDSTSIEVQIESCERAAGGKCEHYIDRAKTGRAMGGRLELLRLLADAEAGKIGRVFVYKFDRLGRAAETHVIAQQLDDAGVALVSATEGTNTLARGIQLVVADDYSRQLAERTRAGLVKRAEQGGFTGGVVPFGYHATERNGRRVLEVDPAEAEIVRDVVGQYLRESVGFKILARRMRERGIPSRRQNDNGKRRSLGWSYTSVRAMLVNPMYTGRVRFNRRKMRLDRARGKRVPQFKPEAEHVERQDESLRIIDDATFEAIQQRMSKRTTGVHRSPHGLAPFTGLVYCECGAKCHRVKSANAKGVYHYYLCSRKMRYDECPCGGHRVREDMLLGMVQDRFARVFRHRDRIIERALGIATAATQQNRTDAERIKAELLELDAEQDRRGELLMDRALPEAAKTVIGRQMADAEQRRQMLLASLDRLREQANADTEGLAATIRQVFDEARDRLATATTPEEMNRLFDEFIGPVTVNADGGLAQKEPPAEVASGLQKVIAGEGFEPSTSGL